MSVSDMASSGGRLEALIALRDVLALQIDCVEKPADLAALSRQFRDTLAEIEKLGAGVKQEGSVLDEFSKRLADRRSGSARRTGS